jgi:hypothetical protein
MLMPDLALSEHEALAEFHELLRDSAQGQSPARHLPVRYQVCRNALVTGPLRGYLPGFVKPCVSLYKFREFIALFDQDPTKRLKFIDRTLEDCWTLLNERPAHTAPDAFDVDEF